MMGSNEFRFSGRGFLTTHFRTRPLDGLDNIVIACAAAEITGDAPADLIFRRIVVMFKQFDAAHDHTRRAEAAVQSMVLLESFLQRMERTSFGCQTFDRGDAVTIGLYSQDGAALDALAIEQDRAGAAAAGIATDVGSGHVEDLADHVHEQQPGFDLQFVMCAIDGD